MTHHPAAFINAIAEEGTKAEAIEYLQKTWNENCELRAEVKRLSAENAEMVRVCDSYAAENQSFHDRFTAAEARLAELSAVTVSRDELREGVFACASSTLCGFEGELTQRQIQFICQQIADKAALDYPESYRGRVGGAQDSPESPADRKAET